MGKKMIIAPEVSSNKKAVSFDDEVPASKPDPILERRLKKLEQRKFFTEPYTELAQSNVFFTNYRYYNAHLIYPNQVDVDQRFVDRCYPHAKDGLLLVDFPENDREAEKDYEKQKKLLALGMRHVVYRDGMDLYALAKQLEGDTHGMVDGNTGSQDQAE